jgi:hypothetical protein
MKVYSNASKKKSKKGKDAPFKPATEAGSSEKNARYEVEEISNGFIVTKSWSDKGKDGYSQYHSVKEYYKENPINL